MILNYFEKILKKQFLISELHRFVKENNRNPMALDMQRKFGYPSVQAYINHFGSFNNALEIAVIKLNKTRRKLNGTETCGCCDCNRPNGQGWYYENNIRYCMSCFSKLKSDYINGNLDKNSTVAKGFVGQRVVAKVLNIPVKNDCNCNKGFDSKYDLYNEEYGKIDVKTCRLRNNGVWGFNFNKKQDADTYICLGFDNNRKYILHVWLIKNEKKYQELKVFNVHNSIFGLKKYEKFEVDSEPYDLILYKLSLKRKETNGKNCVLNSDDLMEVI